jgi:hypothetical protein
MASLTIGGVEGRITLDLRQFSTQELLVALAAFVELMEGETPNDEEQVAIYAVCSEIDSRGAKAMSKAFSRRPQHGCSESN